MIIQVEGSSELELPTNVAEVEVEADDLEVIPELEETPDELVMPELDELVMPELVELEVTLDADELEVMPEVELEEVLEVDEDVGFDDIFVM